MICLKPKPVLRQKLEGHRHDHAMHAGEGRCSHKTGLPAIWRLEEGKSTLKEGQGCVSKRVVV